MCVCSIERRLFYEEPGKYSACFHKYQSQRCRRPRMNLKQPCRNQALNDGPVQNISAVREVSPAGWTSENRQQESGAKDQGGDSEGPENKPPGGQVENV